MQTMPAFVWLVPVVFLFGIGYVPGVVATIIFAVAPGVRLTELGRPFAIASGGGAEVAGHGESAHLRKPFKVENVETVLRTLASQA